MTSNLYFVRIGQYVMTWLWNKADLDNGKEIEISFGMRKFTLYWFLKDQVKRIRFVSLKEMIRQYFFELYFNSLKFNELERKKK